MADASQLTYASLQAYVKERRFPDSLTGAVQAWLAAAYQDVWDAADWDFKQVPRQTFYTSSDATSNGTATAKPRMPGDFAYSRRLYDENGYPVDYMDADSFDDDYASTTSTGAPEAFTVVNRQIILAPTPNRVYALSLPYRRRMAHKNTSGVVVAGFLSADTDYPLWDDHHYLLVPRAKTLGLQSIGDPTWTDLHADYQQRLGLMVGDYVTSGPVQYGS